MKNSYLGPKYSFSEIEKQIKEVGNKISFEYFKDDKEFNTSS